MIVEVGAYLAMKNGQRVFLGIVGETELDLDITKICPVRLAEVLERNEVRIFGADSIEFDII